MDNPSNSKPPSAQPIRSRWRAFLVCGALAVVTFAGLAFYWVRLRNPTPPAFDDPRLTFNSPYLNVRPNVRYVSDEKCANCHLDLAESFKHHPMGQSLGAFSEMPRVETDAAIFQTQGLQYEVKRTTDGMTHAERKLDREGKRVWELERPVAFVFGSGTRGRSYLVQDDGALFQSPISWFSQKETWDLSPGFEKGNRHFQRPIGTDCLHCHVNRFDHVAGTINKYEGAVFQGHAIGCQRCHGPGELHVSEQEASRKSRTGGLTIVNPAKLEPLLRDSVCEQCHLHGDAAVDRMGRSKQEFRPGLPFDLFTTVFVEDGVAPDQFLGQVQQMRSSLCYIASDGKLGCISCHNPHHLPEAGEKIDYFRKRCQECHQPNAKDCSIPEARRTRENGDSCYQCHMGRYATRNIIHTSMTDHRVVRRPKPPEPRDPFFQKSRVAPELVRFHQSATASQGLELERDFAAAVLEKIANSNNTIMAKKAVEKLLPALEKWPHDIGGLQALELGYYLLDKKQESLETSERILRLDPGQEKTLQSAFSLALVLDRPAQAREYAGRLVKLNPGNSENHFAMSLVHFNDKEYEQAVAAARDTLRLMPSHAEARLLLVRALAQQGNESAAGNELRLYARSEGSVPPNLRYLLKK
ncbi:MAG: hypothetical protein HY040_01400 [Planctomycetes bacterium]|nr:hypothetical protein [Planctomycetota bacterium]